ncbi:hypothetical protein INR49_022823 [Caranx melampygus]|nr:hypothetical protein INR49_022823 [Caranx melampygus]
MMMKSDVSGPFLLLLLLLFSSSAPGLGSVLVKRYSFIHSYYTWDKAQSYCRYRGADCEDYKFFICCYYDSEDNYRLRFIPQTKTWSEAQQFCRTQYSDLATIRYSGDLLWVSGLQDFMVWTGLHRDGRTWKWTKGRSEYRRWAVNEPGTNGNCVSVSSQSHLMWTQSCSARFPFICYSDNVILVKENKTWEEALEHCRALNAQYELVSVVPGTEHDFVMTKVTPANTEEVWIGLRYLAGGWLWVNGANVLYPDLPICPGFGQHCGALIKNNTGGVEARDCTERKNFLCYRKTF